MIPSLTVDLGQAPQDRWPLSPQQISWGQSLVETTLAEIGGVEPHRELVELYAAEYLGEVYAAELTDSYR